MLTCTWTPKLCGTLKVICIDTHTGGAAHSLVQDDDTATASAVVTCRVKRQHHFQCRLPSEVQDTMNDLDLLGAEASTQACASAM